MIKVLIIGAGRIAGLNEKDNYRKKPCTHYGAFASNQEFKVLGVVDVDKNRASYFADQFKIKYYYTDIEKAIENVQPGDIVLIAGKGHEPYQIFSHSTIEFDDRKVASKICRNILAKPV